MEVREAEAEAGGREAEVEADVEMEALSWRELTFCSNALILSLSSRLDVVRLQSDQPAVGGFPLIEFYKSGRHLEIIESQCNYQLVN